MSENACTWSIFHEYARAALAAPKHRNMAAPREPAAPEEQFIFQGFTVSGMPRLGGIPRESSLFVSRRVHGPGSPH